MKNPTEISQICRQIYLAAAVATASALLPSPDPTQMDFRLTCVCVEVKIFGLFMEFSNEEMGERRKLDW